MNDPQVYDVAVMLDVHYGEIDTGKCYAALLCLLVSTVQLLACECLGEVDWKQRGHARTKTRNNKKKTRNGLRECARARRHVHWR